MDMRRIFLERHACVHSEATHKEGWWHEEDNFCSGLSESDLRRRPLENHNSIAWLLWHLARCEDVAVNTVIRDTHEVLDRDHWLHQLNIDSRHIGTGATKAEVEGISQAVNLPALRAYRAAVGRETRAWASTLEFDSLDKRVTAAAAKRANDKGDLGEQAQWVESYWADKDWTQVDFLFWLAIEHNWFHIGQIWLLRVLLSKAFTATILGVNESTLK